MRRYAFLLAGLVLVAGCDQSKAKLEQALAEQQAVSAQKDSLMAEILETSKFVTDVNTELAKVKGLNADGTVADPGVPGAARDRDQRQQTLAQVQAVITRLTEKEAELERNSERLKVLTKRDSRLGRQLAEYKKSLADLKAEMETQATQLTAIIDSQKTEIVTLGARVDTLNVEKTALRDTVGNLTTAQNTAYYVAGTEKELKEKGIVVKEGSKFLVFGGTSLQPSRRPDPSLFTRIDLTQDSVIVLPDSAKKYKIVSRQSPEFLDTTTVEQDGKVKGELHIQSPTEFWAASKFLILVQD